MRGRSYSPPPSPRYSRSPSPHSRYTCDPRDFGFVQFVNPGDAAEAKYYMHMGFS